jgi:hypothetical protein
VPKMPGTSERIEMACRATTSYVQTHIRKERGNTHISNLSLGPSAGSYRPPRLGRFKSSSKTGLTMVLTDILRMSSVDRKEKEMLPTVDETGREIFMNEDQKRILSSRFGEQNIPFTSSQYPDQPRVEWIGRTKSLQRRPCARAWALVYSGPTRLHALEALSLSVNTLVTTPETLTLWLPPARPCVSLFLICQQV